MKPFGFKAFLGAPSGIRTPDTLLKRQVLCRLSYWVRSKKFCAEYEIKSYAVMAGTAGFAFQRESHGGSNNPPDYSQEPPFESKDSKSAIMAGTAGFEPANVGVKRPMPYRLATPPYSFARNSRYPKDNALRSQRVTGLYGVGKGTRTLDPRNHNPML